MIAERPVFFTGYGHFGQVVADMEKWPNYGTNIIQIDIAPTRVFPKDGVTSDAPMREMLHRRGRVPRRPTGATQCCRSVRLPPKPTQS